MFEIRLKRNYNLKLLGEDKMKPFEIEISILAEELDEYGLVCDFHEVEDHLQSIMEEFDVSIAGHRDFAGANPAFEDFARYLSRRLGRKLTNTRQRLHSVELQIDSVRSIKYVEPPKR